MPSHQQMPAVLLLLLFLPFQQTANFRIGAVFREQEDAHLVAAFNYSLHWIHSRSAIHSNDNGLLGTVSGFSETLTNPNDHYELIDKACRLVNEREVLALIGPSQLHLSEQLAELAKKLQIPSISVVDPLQHHHLDAVGNIFPDQQLSGVHLEMFPQTQLIEAVVDLIKHWRWSRVIVVFTEPERIRRLAVFLENDSLASIRFHFVHVEDGGFLRAAKLVKEMEQCDGELHYRQQHGQCSEFSRLLLDMDPRDTHHFLLASLKVGLVELKHWFLSTSLDLRYMDMELFSHNHAHFLGLDPVAFDDEGNPSRQTESEQPPLPDFTEFRDYVRAHWMTKNPLDGSLNFKMSEASFLFDSIYLLAHAFSDPVQKMLIASPAEGARCAGGTRSHQPFGNGPQMAQVLKNSTLRGLTGHLDRLGAQAVSSNFTFRINLIGYTGTISDIGFWESSSDVLHVNMTGNSHAQLRRNVKVSDELKPHFRVTTILERPYVMLRSNDFGGGAAANNNARGHNSQFEGFCIDLLAELADDLGFTYTIHVVRDKKYGNDNGNNTWDGMIGEILRGEADMVVAPFTANFRRAEVVDFTKPFLSLGISILYRIPQDYQPDIFSFLNPLSLEIWVCVLLAIFGLTFGMHLVANVTPYEWNLNFSCCTAHQPHPAAQFSTVHSSTTKVQLSNNYSFWNTLWFLVGLHTGHCQVYNAYTANLAAVLTISRPHIPIRSIDDLANQSDISYGTIHGGSTMQFFQESKIEAHAKMWSRMHKMGKVFVRNNREGVEKVLREKYAYLMESSSLEYEVQQNCNLTQIGGVLGSKGYGIALQKNSEWTDRISRQILFYQKRGIIAMKKTKWWRSKGASCHGVGSSVKQQRISLNLQNVSGLFVILALGLFLSVFIVGLEFYVRKREQRLLSEQSCEDDANNNDDSQRHY